MDIYDLFAIAKAKNASDVHITVNSPPVYRIDGDLFPEGDILTSVETEAMAKSLMTENQWHRFMRAGEIDLSFSVPDMSRLRINVYHQQGACAIAARLLSSVVPTWDELNLPKVLCNIAEKEYGLVLVTGPTGSGKSTTLAAMIQHINATRHRHIITLEDPIEYTHRNQKSIVNQREIGLDSQSFAMALRAALRQDPDIILVGEMRDLETISTAITAAETGHLVLASLHTRDTVQTIDRIVDVFPSSQQGQVRLQLASLLLGVISQRLFRKKSGVGRIAALEILINNTAVSNLIRTEKTHQIRSILQTNRTMGMHTMEMHVKEMIADGILEESALQYFEKSI